MVYLAFQLRVRVSCVLFIITPGPCRYAPSGLPGANELIYSADHLTYQEAALQNPGKFTNWIHNEMV